MLEKLYNRVLAMAAHPRATWVLAVVSFIESSVFPIPPDMLLIPMALAKRERAYAFAAICTTASVLGGLAGYVIGYFLFESLGQPILEFYGQTQNFAAFAAAYSEWGWWIVVGAGLTPFPYKMITIASGMTGLDLGTFIVASVLSRGVRFFFEAALLWYLGPSARHFIEQNLNWATTVFFVALFGGFLLIRYAF